MSKTPIPTAFISSASPSKQQRMHHGWHFVFLGANQDPITTGGSLGFAAASVIDFDADATGAQEVLRSVSASVSTSRVGGRGAFTETDRRNASHRRS